MKGAYSAEVPSTLFGFSLPPSSFLSQPKRFSEFGTCFRVARGDHRVIGTEAPLRPVLLRREPAPSEMPLHRFVPPAILKADDVVRADSLVDWHRRLMLLGLRRRLCHIPEGLVNARDQLWYFRRLNVVLGNVSRYDLGADADQVGLLFVLHRFSPT